MKNIKQLNTSHSYFELFQLAEGVYAAIGANHPGAYSNAGIIDLGDQTLVFDTFTTPSAGLELCRAAEQLTGRQTDIIINSHAHTHHWMGNQVFPPETIIITTHANRLGMQTMADYLLALKNDPSEFEAQIQEHQIHLKTNNDPRWQVSLEYLIGRMQASLASLPNIAPRLPNQTFENRLAFHGTQRCVEVFEGGGHSASDAYLFLPEERIVFLGDLGSFQRQPFLPYGNAAAWLEELAGFKIIEADLFVPGHGLPGDKSDLALQQEYIKVLLGLVNRVYSQGGNAQDMIEEPLPEPFDSWLTGGMVHFETNIKSLFQRMTEN